MKVWLIKYAVSTTVIEAYEVEAPGDRNPRDASYVRIKRPGWAAVWYKLDWDVFLSQVEAEKAAREMLMKKIKSLENKLAQLYSIGDFNYKEIE